jgi:ADP-ribose pyrophosphatase YjhB (NUDIX family)
MRGDGGGASALFVLTLTVGTVIITMGSFLSSPKMPDKRKLAGCVPMRQSDSKVCLINSRSDPSRLVFPKGGIDKGEGAREAALRETWEEAGLRGEVQERIGIVDGCEWFVMAVHGEEGLWPEMDQRNRHWCTAGEALAREDLKGTTRRVLMRLNAAEL